MNLKQIGTAVVTFLKAHWKAVALIAAGIAVGHFV